MYLMIDNYDSFVYNLKAYFEELGREIVVKRSDQITVDEIEKMQPQGIILSPGPKRPWDAEVCVQTVERLQGKIPILGVCLGHQVLGHCCGATVKKGERPMHGKVTEITNMGTGVFEGLPKKFKVTRYERTFGIAQQRRCTRWCHHLQDCRPCSRSGERASGRTDP